MKLMTPFLTTITACAWMTVPCSRLAGYGAERTRYIVAAAIQVRDGDARISPQNRRWADSVRTIQDINADGYDKAVYYANLQSHAGLIDIFTSRLRQLEREKTAPER